MPAGPKIAENYWSAKPTKPTPYVAPNKVHWKLSEILAAHRGKTDWVQPIIRNQEQDADYISLGAGKKTKTRMYADDRVVWIVQDGSMKVTIDGVEPFVATKGFMVSVPFRHLYSIETVGDKPSLRFEVRQAGSPPLFPLSETPDAYPGRTYMKVRGSPGPATIATGGTSNPIWVDFLKDIAVGDKPYNGKFVGTTTSPRTSCAARQRRCRRQPTRAISMSTGPSSGSSWKARSVIRSRASPISRQTRAMWSPPPRGAGTVPATAR